MYKVCLLIGNKFYGMVYCNIDKVNYEKLLVYWGWVNDR